MEECWIKVSEELPTDEGMILVAIEGVAVGVGHFFNKVPVMFASSIGSNVTHWMPLPKPPQKND